MDTAPQFGGESGGIFEPFNLAECYQFKIKVDHLLIFKGWALSSLSVDTTSLAI